MNGLAKLAGAVGGAVVGTPAYASSRKELGPRIGSDDEMEAVDELLVGPIVGDGWDRGVHRDEDLIDPNGSAGTAVAGD